MMFTFPPHPFPPLPAELNFATVSAFAAAEGISILSVSVVNPNDTPPDTLAEPFGRRSR